MTPRWPDIIGRRHKVLNATEVNIVSPLHNLSMSRGTICLRERKLFILEAQIRQVSAYVWKGLMLHELGNNQKHMKKTGVGKVRQQGDTTSFAGRHGGEE